MNCHAALSEAPFSNDAQSAFNEELFKIFCKLMGAVQAKTALGCTSLLFLVCSIACVNTTKILLQPLIILPDFPHVGFVWTKFQH